MTDPRDTSRDLATVTHLPARRDSGEVERDVLDGEIVTEQDYNAIQRQRALERWQSYRGDLVTVGRVTKTVVTHDRTKTTARFVVRHGLHVGTGISVITRRLWEAKTNSRYERVMRSAEARADWDRLEKWEQLGEQARERRHRRTMAWLDAPLILARAVLFGSIAVALLLLAVGALLFAGSGDPADIIGPIRGVITLVTLVAWVVTIVWGPLILAAPWLAVLGLWHVGRKADRTPSWCAPANAKRTGEPITPSVVVTAFRDLGIASLRKGIIDMGDAGAGMLSVIRPAGCGVEVDVTLPSGTSTGDVLARQERLAQNLGRHTHEVFPSVAPQPPRTVRVWAADSGALDEPIGPSPLVVDDTLRADYKTGRAPWGQDLRGDPLGISLYQRHLLITGLSNEGKTRALMALALWLAHDLRVEFWLADLKGQDGEDWHVFKGIATEPFFIRGPTDEHVARATEMLEAAVAEMNRRLQQGGTWDPLIVVVDEEQVAFMCPEKDAAGRPYGGTKANSRYYRAARAILNQGRAVDVLLWQGTQDPTNENLPKMVREATHIRASLVLGTSEQAQMALGEAAVNSGAAPHRLRRGLDKGTLVVDPGGAVKLPRGQTFVTVRTHFIDDDGAAMLAARIRARRTARVRIEEERDLLADVADALHGEETVRASDMAVRLREFAPHYQPYQGLDGKELAEMLKSRYGVEVRNLKGNPLVRATRVFAAIDRREDESDEG
ncbi:MAG: ATP-binding protein [Dehalococcoidia bacterium]